MNQVKNLGLTELVHRILLLYNQYLNMPLLLFFNKQYLNNSCFKRATNTNARARFVATALYHKLLSCLVIVSRASPPPRRGWPVRLVQLGHKSTKTNNNIVHGNCISIIITLPVPFVV